MEEEIEEEKTQRPDLPLPLNMEGWKKKKFDRESFIRPDNKNIGGSEGSCRGAVNRDSSLHLLELLRHLILFVLSLK